MKFRFVAIILMLAAIFVAKLWRENRNLKAELGLFRSSNGSPGSIVANSGNRIKVEKPKSELGVSPAGFKESSKQAEVPASNVAADRTFMRNELLRNAEKLGREWAMRDFTRICLYLPELTEEQKDEVLAALEKKYLQSMQSQFGPEKSEVKRTGQSDEINIDKEMSLILTPEQFTKHAEIAKARQVSEAEDAATEELRKIRNSLDLTTSQKDAIFQALAEDELRRYEALAVSSDVPTLTDDTPEQTKERIIRSHLTGEQIEVLYGKQEAK
jgi:hypothetical protein